MGGLRRRLLGNQNLLAGRTMLALCLALGAAGRCHSRVNYLRVAGLQRMGLLGAAGAGSLLLTVCGAGCFFKGRPRTICVGVATVSGLVAAAIGAVAGLVAIGHTGLVIICTIFGIVFVCGLRFVIAAAVVRYYRAGLLVIRLGRRFFARRKHKNANKHDQRQRP